jgi:DNA-binding MarR family transcriptional regulator
MSSAELLISLTTHYNAIIRSAALQKSLTSAQAILLLNIPFEGISMSGLAHKIGIDNSTLTRNINKLILLGLVFKKQNEFDKRVITIKISTLGLDVVNRLDEALDDFSGSIINYIDIEDQGPVADLLEKLVWALDCSREK